MKRAVHFEAALAVIALALLLAQYIVRASRISPGWLILVALLLGARYAARRQARKRAEILKAVPRRPLGLSEDSGEENQPAP